MGVHISRNTEFKHTITKPEEVDVVLDRAQVAFESYRQLSGKKRALFLRRVGDEIETKGEELIQVACLETGLSPSRIRAERSRTTNQLRMFASLIEKNEWVQAVIDGSAVNDHQKGNPDLRKQLEPVGPVVVFGASNFPLAYSAAGGDTASALAAGCSVIVKAHEAHPRTSQLVADAVQTALEKEELSSDIYQHLHAADFELGIKLVVHPLTKAVGFTGSFKGGKALFDLANQRPDPIPVFAEMGSTNPIYIFPDVVEDEHASEEWSKKIADSIVLDAGQFCTNPGILIVQQTEHLTHFLERISAHLLATSPQKMLHKGIAEAFHQSVSELAEDEVIAMICNPKVEDKLTCCPVLAGIRAEDFVQHKKYREEVFGSFTLVVICQNSEELDEVVSALEGQLTGTLITGGFRPMNLQKRVDQMKEKVGRIIFNGVPTGVEVCGGMHHGGPFPSTTDARFTAVGPSAIIRFTRPVSYQNFPDELLPAALKNENPLNIFRIVNGERTKKAL